VSFSIGRLGRVSTYVQHVRGIIGHVTVKAGNVVGTDGMPPQVPPKTLRCQAQRLSRFGVRALRSGRPDADEEDEVAGGVVGGRLKVTCRSRPCCFGGGARTGGPCATGQPLRGGLAGSVSAGVRAAFRRSVDTLLVLSPISRRKKCVDRSSTR
jgi:hypothetical protein